jgi:hypothetical protein
MTWLSERGKSNKYVSDLGLFGDALGDFGLSGLADAEVAGSGLDGGQTERPARLPTRAPHIA